MRTAIVTDSEIGEAIKLHIIGAIPIYKIEESWGLHNGYISKKMRKLGVAVNKHCHKPNKKTHRKCTRCGKMLPHKFFGGSKGFNVACKNCVAEKYIITKMNRSSKIMHPLEILKKGLKKYKLSVEEYGVLQEKQQGMCGICKESLVNPTYDKFDMVVDHNHNTGEVRGLLCGLCNTGIGALKDDRGLMLNAAKWLT